MSKVYFTYYRIKTSPCSGDVLLTSHCTFRRFFLPDVFGLGLIALDIVEEGFSR